MIDDTHPCPISRCVMRVESHQLMCRKHWKLVPANIQSRVYAAWANGRGGGTDEHIHAMDAAIAASEEKLATR